MHGPQSASVWAVLAFATSSSAAAGAWVVYFRWKDRHRPEPLWLVFVALAGGAGATVLALLGFAAGSYVGEPTTWAQVVEGGLSEAVLTVAKIGLVEESAKLVPVLLIALFTHHVDEPLDGIVYSGFTGIGFALAETALLLSTGEVETRMAMARVVAAPLTHAMFAAPWGYGITLRMIEGRWAPVWIGGCVSAVTHGTYDFLVARAALPAVSAVVVLILWLWVLWIVPRLATRRA